MKFSIDPWLNRSPDQNLRKSAFICGSALFLRVLCVSVVKFDVLHPCSFVLVQSVTGQFQIDIFQASGTQLDRVNTGYLLQFS